MSKLLLAAGSAAGVAAVIYCVLKEEVPASSGKATTSSNESHPIKAASMSKKQLLAVLRDITSSQDAMRVQMKTLTKELQGKSTSFDETYKRVKAVQPDDPLERHGLTMNDLDALIQKHQNDPEVMKGVQAIMGDPSVHAQPAANPGKSADVKTLIGVHKSMLQELEKVTSMVLGDSSKKGKYDMKTVTLAAQAVIGAKLEESWGLTSEDIERAVIAKHEELAVNEEFAAVNKSVQTCMQKLLDA